MAKEQSNFLTVLLIIGCVYCLYITSVILLWCVKMCLRKVTAILPLYALKHRYVVQITANTWAALKTTTEVWLSIQGQNGSSSFYVLPKKVPTDEDPTVQVPKNFAIETSACLKQLLSLTLHVKGRDLQLWDVDTIVVHDTHHNTSYTFSLQCTLVVPMCATLYVVSIQKKAMTHFMYAKLVFQFYHNWVAIVTKLSIETDISPNINLTLLLCTLVSSLLSALIVVSRQMSVPALDASEVLHFISFFYLLVTNLAIDVIIHCCKRRGANKMVWGQRSLSYRTMLENKYVAVVSKISLETHDRIDSLMSAIAANPTVMIQEGITSHDVDMITAIKVATIRQKGSDFSSTSTFDEEELSSFTNPDYRDRFRTATTGTTTDTTHSNGMVSAAATGKADKLNNELPAGKQQETHNHERTLESCLFFPFDSRQLHENRIYLWVNFLEEWNDFKEAFIKAFIKSSLDASEWYLFSNVSDITLVRQELARLHQTAQNFQKERIQLQRTSVFPVDSNGKDRTRRTVAVGNKNENKTLFLLLRETTLLFTSDLLDAVRLHQLEHCLPLTLRCTMENKLKDLVVALFDEGYLVITRPRVEITTSSPEEIPAIRQQNFECYYPPNHAPTFSMPIDLAEVSKSRSIVFHFDSRSFQMNPRISIKQAISLPNIKAASERSPDETVPVSEVNREDILLMWGQWISTLIDVILKKSLAVIQCNVHDMVFSQAIEYILMQKRRSTWNEGCSEYVALLCGVIAKTLIESMCVFLGLTKRELILNNLQETLRHDVLNATSHPESNIASVLVNRYEELMHSLKESIDRNRALTDNPKWHTSLAREQYRLLYLLNSKITFEQFKKQSELCKIMNGVLRNCIQQLKYVKSRIVILREEMEMVVFTKQWRSRQEILVKCVDLTSRLVQLEEFVGKVELHLDAIYLDVPHAAMDFEYSDVNMLRVDRILSAYFGDMRDVLLPRTPLDSSDEQYGLAENSGTGSLGSNIGRCEDANTSTSNHTDSELSAKSVESSHSGTRRIGVVSPPTGHAVLNTAGEMARDLLNFLHNPCRPSLSYFCRQGTIAFLVAEIFFVTVAVIVLSSTKEHPIGNVIYVMVGAIICDAFILQPAKCSLFFVTRWLYQNENVYELYESDTLGKKPYRRHLGRYLDQLELTVKDIANRPYIQIDQEDDIE